MSKYANVTIEEIVYLCIKSVCGGRGSVVCVYMCLHAFVCVCL